MPDLIRHGIAVSAIHTPMHPYVTYRLRKRKHVGIWYFTKDGLAEAKTLPRSTDSDLMFLKDTTTGVVALGPSWSKGSQNFVEDKDLTWYEWTYAKMAFTDAMQDCGWSQELLAMYAQFFTDIDYHELRRIDRVLGDRNLTYYLHHARLDLHAKIETDMKGDFAAICPKRLEAPATRIRDEEMIRCAVGRHTPG